MLKCFGLTTHESKVMMYLLEHKDVTQREIERALDIRQGDVSTAVSSLHRMGYVTFIPGKMERGRSLKLYSALPNTFIEQMSKRTEEDYKKRMDRLNSFRKSVHDSI